MPHVHPPDVEDDEEPTREPTTPPAGHPAAPAAKPAGPSPCGILQALYVRPMNDSSEALSYYYGDVVPWESTLLKEYDEVLPQIDRVLEGQP